MRTFEYVGAGAAKFWQVERTDRSVTVEYGRIGTAGRSQTKEFGTVAEAAAHAEKLIGEKTRKGYVEKGSTAAIPSPDVTADPATSSPSVTDEPAVRSPSAVDGSAVPSPGAAADRSPVGAVPVTELPDEDTFEVPSTWKRSALPRRDRPRGRAPEVDAATFTAGEQLLSQFRPGIDRLLDHPETDPTLAAEGRAMLAGTPTVWGGGAVAAAVMRAVGWRDTERAALFADVWVRRYGVAFTAAAVTAMVGMSISGDSRQDQAVLRWQPEVANNSWSYHSSRRVLLERVREHLAAADDEAYAAAVAALAEQRDTLLPVRAVISFLVPTQTDWVDGDCAELASHTGGMTAELLWCAASTVTQLEAAAARMHWWSVIRSASRIYTAALTVGPEAAPALARWLDNANVDADGRKRLLAVIGAIPTDEAMTALLTRLDQKYVQPALLEMLARYPARGVRLLAAAATAATASGRLAETLLPAHVLANPAARDAVLPALTDEARALVEAVLAERAALPPAAPAEALPAVLVAPPWTIRRKRPAAPVVAGLTRRYEESIAWRPGEREEWVAIPPGRVDNDLKDRDLAGLAALLASGRLPVQRQLAFFERAPEQLAAPLLPHWRPKHAANLRWWAGDRQPGDWLRRLIGRYGVTALPLARHVIQDDPSVAAVLLPVASTTVADQMADWAARLKTLRPLALAWLDRHPLVAARALLPAALAAPGAGRRVAEAALRVVAVGHRQAVLAAADEYGPAAVEAVTALLDTDPLELLPTRMPTLPAWMEPGQLPPVLLRDRSAVLPADAVRHLCTMLAISKPGEVYPGLDAARAACDPVSLAGFGWALFERWRVSGAPTAQGWVLPALGWLGDDETARRLAPVIRAWPGEGGHARAVAGLDVLAAIGTDVALMHLYGISQKVKFRGLKERAGEKVAEVAEELGLSAEQLGDRLVPDLGLDDAGSLVLDYGPRRFTVGFDEQLRPYVRDEQGARRKELPKPGAKDDQTLAPEAHRRFAALKKDVRTLAADQIRRFEAAMVTQRRWPAADFRRHFLDHPLLWHVVRRLVWVVVDDTGEVRSAFRVAEDRSLADVADEAFELSAGATVGLAHPLHLADELPTWSELFADYEILQPFAQLGRETYRLTDAERAEQVLKRFADAQTAAGKLLGLERRGWRRGTPQDAGIQSWLERELPGNRAVVVNIDPGIAVGMVDEFPDQKIDQVWLNDQPTGDWRPRGLLRFGDLDPVTASELLRDLTEVTA